MNFQHKISEWKNKGKEPGTTLKTIGFIPKYKPPASFFNWFWAKVIDAITELQNKLSASEPVVGYYYPTDEGVYETEIESDITIHKNVLFQNLGFIPKAIYITSSNGEFFMFSSPTVTGEIEDESTPFVNNFSQKGTGELYVQFIGTGVIIKGLEDKSSASTVSATSQHIAANQNLPGTIYHYIIIR